MADPKVVWDDDPKVKWDEPEPSLLDKVMAFSQSAVDQGKQVAEGAIKSGTQHVMNLAGYLRQISGIGTAIKAISPDPLEGIVRASRPTQPTPAPYSMFNEGGQKAIGMAPEGTGQKIGAAGESIGEFFLPGAAATKGAGIIGKAIPALASKVPQLAVRAGLEGLGMGALSKAQGSSDTGAAVNTVLGAASPYAGVAVKAVAEKLPATIVNNMLRPLLKQYRFGKNAGQGIVDEGIIAGSMPRLAEKVAAAKTRVGRQIGDILDAPENQIQANLSLKNQPLQLPSGPRIMGPSNPGEVPQTVLSKSPQYGDMRSEPFEQWNKQNVERKLGDATNAQQIEWIEQQAKDSGLLAQVQSEAKASGKPIPTKLSDMYDISFSGKPINIHDQMGSIDDAISKATEVGDDALINKLEETKTWLTNQMGRDSLTGKTTPISPRGPVNPKEATRLKGRLGEETRWTGEAYDKPLNEARAKTYGKIRSAIEEQVPEVAPLNEHYSNLLEAQSIAERRANANPNLRLSEIGLGALGEGLMPHAGLAAALTAMGLRTAPGATALAQLIKNGTVPAGTTLKDLVAAFVASNSGRNSPTIGQ
jgi:hypothetical protein